MYRATYSESVQIADWFEALDDLAISCEDACIQGEARLVRALCSLLDACPPGIAGIAGRTSLRDEVEARIAVGAYDSAVLRLLPDRAGALFSRSGRHEHVASVVLDGQLEESTSRAPSLALALIAALSGALCAMRPAFNYA